MMWKKADTLKIGEYSPYRRRCSLFHSATTFAAVLNDFANMLTITAVSATVAQFVFKSLSHLFNVSVLAEDKWKYNPIVTRTHLAIGARIAHEGALAPG